MQTKRHITELTYHPEETYEEFCTRRQDALEQGRQAVRERRISGDLFLFYEYLIERVGGNRYSWVSEETMTAYFGVDRSTIKRWIAKLVRAGLIRRQRQFATSSRTYITAYDPATEILDGQAEEPTADQPNQHTPEPPQAEADPTPAQEVPTNAGEAVSFWRRSAPTFGADLPPDSFKVPHLNLGGGGGRDTSKTQPVVPEIRLLLEREGVTTFYVAPQLQHTPLDELRAVSRYLDQQHNVRDRARLFAALAVQGFGGLLLAGRAQRPPQATQRSGRPANARPPQGDDHLKYVSGELAPYIKTGRSDDDPPARSPEPMPAASEPDSTLLQQTWQQALDALRRSLPAAEFQTWFEEARLVQLEDGQAVIGTPNIFAKEKLEARYTQQLTEALGRSVGQPVTVTIVIGG